MNESCERLEAESFQEFPKLYRLFRDIIVTEKIDGTNAQIVISDDGLSLRAGSRNRWIAPGDDNFGFARWCADNTEDLLKLGPGRHFGEWWGAGIQRRYGLTEKRFSLFNVARWGDDATRPACCHVVPTLYASGFSQAAIDEVVAKLKREGSRAAPGFDKPEGIVVFHVPSGHAYKYTLDGDGHKGATK